jgi:hypothetical protein
VHESQEGSDPFNQEHPIVCVIAIVEDERFRPSIAEIDAMWEANSHGAGIAWRLGSKKIHFEKGLNLDQVQRLIETAPPPFVVHFRVPSVGGDVPRLTHPFVVEPTAPLLMSGDITGKVLFHNGHWNEWEHYSKQMVAAAGGKVKIPGDKWSDSRAMAFLAGNFGEGILEWIDEKVVLFGPGKSADEGIDVYHDTGFSRVNGFIVSNEYWKHRVRKKSWVETRREEKEKNGEGATAKSGSTSDSGSSQPGGAGADVPFHELVESLVEESAEVIMAREEYDQAMLKYSLNDLSNNKMKKARRKFDMVRIKVRQRIQRELKALQVRTAVKEDPTLPTPTLQTEPQEI